VSDISQIESAGERAVIVGLETLYFPSAPPHLEKLGTRQFLTNA